MGFAIEAGKPVGREFRRIAAEEFEVTIGRLTDPENGGLAVAVHESRKSCKRLRALFRIVRPSIPERKYRFLNASVRDAARELSPARDAQALIGMFDDLLAAHGADPKDDLMAVVRAGLEQGAAEADWGDTAGVPRPLIRARERLEMARDGAAAAKLADDDFAALRGGLGDTYQRGRKALDRLRREGSADDSHDWRKAVKYTWHHLQLLEDTAPSVLIPAAQQFHLLSDALGDAHNLVVLAGDLTEIPSRYGGRSAIEPVVDMAAASRADLEERAVRLGLRLYAEPPIAFVARLRAYWQVERTAGDELPTGELAEVVDVAGPAEADAEAVVESAEAG